MRTELVYEVASQGNTLAVSRGEYRDNGGLHGTLYPYFRARDMSVP
jgi:hypothetical protein